MAPSITTILGVLSVIGVMSIPLVYLTIVAIRADEHSPAILTEG